MESTFIIVLLFLFFNFITFYFVYYDKQCAIHHRYRIQESIFFILAIIGGSMGILCGMYFFHHKTKKKQFVYGIPMIMISELFVFFLSLIY